MDKTAGKVLIICGLVAAFALILMRYIQREGSLVFSCSQHFGDPSIVRSCESHQWEASLWAVVVVCAGIAAWVINARRP